MTGNRRKYNQGGRGMKRLIQAFVTVLVVLFIMGFAYSKINDSVWYQKMIYQVDYIEEIQAAGERHTISPYLIAAIIECESNWDPEANSNAGAVGLMQLMPATAQDLADNGYIDDEVYPVSELADPVVNIEYGTTYLKVLVDRYQEIEPAVASYNAGLGNVDVWLGEADDIRDSIAYPETSIYLLKVVKAKEKYTELYPDTWVWPVN